MKRTSGITVRRYAASDAEALLALFRESVWQIACRDYGPAQLAAWAPEQIDRKEWAARRAATTTLVAEVGAAIAGFTDLDASGLVDMLYVHPHYQRRGVASALLSTIEALARSRDLTTLRVEASLTARPLFERAGFRCLTAQSVERNGQFLFNYRMEMRLS